MRDEMERLSTMRSREINRIAIKTSINEALLSLLLRSLFEALHHFCVTIAAYDVTYPKTKRLLLAQHLKIDTAYTDTRNFCIFTDIGTATNGLQAIISLNYELNKTQRYLKCTATGGTHHHVDNDNNVYGFGLADAENWVRGDTSSTPACNTSVLQSKLRRMKCVTARGLF